MAAQMASLRLHPFLLALSVLTASFVIVHSFDPQPLRDFDIPGKPPGVANASDFFSTALRGEPVVAPGAGAGTLNLGLMQFPGLNTQGMSAVKLKILPCGMNPPHVHPRGTELLYVLRGELFVAFIDTNQRIFANKLSRGDSTVFPRGLIHTVVNIGKRPAQILATFNSQNPGTTRVAAALFKSRDAKNETFPMDILATAFGVTPGTVESLKLTVPAVFPLGNAAAGCPGRFDLY